MIKSGNILKSLGDTVFLISRLCNLKVQNWSEFYCCIPSNKHECLLHRPSFLKMFNIMLSVCSYSVQFSHSVVSNSLQPHGLQHTMLSCPSPTPGAYSNSCPLCWWCHPPISSSVVSFSSLLHSFPASGPFPMSQLFASGGQSIGVSALASALPMNTKDWFPLGLTGWLSLQSKGLPRVFSNTTVQKHEFFSAQLSL